MILKNAPPLRITPRSQTITIDDGEGQGSVGSNLATSMEVRRTRLERDGCRRPWWSFDAVVAGGGSLTHHAQQAFVQVDVGPPQASCLTAPQRV